MGDDCLPYNFSGNVRFCSKTKLTKFIMVSYMLHQSFLMRNNVFGGSDLDSAKAGKVGRAICPLLSTPPVLSAFGLDF